MIRSFLIIHPAVINYVLYMQSEQSINVLYNSEKASFSLGSVLGEHNDAYKYLILLQLNGYDKGYKCVKDLFKYFRTYFSGSDILK